MLLVPAAPTTVSNRTEREPLFYLGIAESTVWYATSELSYSGRADLYAWNHVTGSTASMKVHSSFVEYARDLDLAPAHVVGDRLYFAELGRVAVLQAP